MRYIEKYYLNNNNSSNWEDKILSWIEILKKNFNDKIFLLFDGIFFDSRDRKVYNIYIGERSIEIFLVDTYLPRRVLQRLAYRGRRLKYKRHFSCHKTG